MDSNEPVRHRTVLIANPAFDVYGSDLQMLESVVALRSAGWRVVVCSPTRGALADRLEAVGAETRLLKYPLVRRADASPRGVLRLGAAAAAAGPRMRRVIREVDPSVIYVNTLTLPWWIAAGRAAGRPTLCHVHEAEVDLSAIARKGLTAPLRLATVAVMNSRVSLEVACEVIPTLRSRCRVIYNGLEPPSTPPRPPPRSTSHRRLVVVSRLSPRKAPHIALEATARLREEGRDVSIELCGTPVPGKEAYAEELAARAREPDLDGVVDLTGYTSPLWPVLARADVFVAPSLGESFGNAVVESQLALRPVVATAVGGHLDTVLDDQTGLLVPAGDPVALAEAVARLLDEPALADRLAHAAQARALELFTSERYGSAIVSLIEELVAARPRSA